MGEMLLGEADALLRAITELLPFANGAAGDVVIHLRKTLAALVITGEGAPPDPAAKVHREVPRPAHDGLTIGVRRVDPEWPGIRDRVQAAMTARAIGPTGLGRIVKTPAGTLRKYLGGTVPPPDVRERLLAWIDQPATASPSPKASKPRAPRMAPPPAPREVTAPPPATFPRAAPFRMGAAESGARA